MNRSQKFIVLAAVSLLLISERFHAQTLSASRISTHAGCFVENIGQWDGDFRYRARAGAMTVFVEPTGWLLTLEEFRARNPENNEPATERKREFGNDFVRRVAVRMRFAGNAQASTIIPEDCLPGIHNYYLGNDPSRWRAGVKRYRGIRLMNVRAGIDVVARIENGNFKYDVVVHPGADIGDFAIEVEGADGIHVDPQGQLAIATALGPVVQPIPKTWQVLPSDRQEPVQCRYKLTKGNGFGFEAASRSKYNALVIDPPLLFSTSLGGSAQDSVNAVAVDASGDITVAGRSTSSDYPTTTGAYATGLQGNAETVVTRLSATGDSLIFSTFIGGSSDDEAMGIAVNSGGETTVVGRTDSTNFPATAGAFDTTSNGGSDIYVARLQPTGGSLVFSTLIGGGSVDVARAVAVDVFGTTTVSGDTWSADYPTTVGAYDTVFNGGVWLLPGLATCGVAGFGDAFVTRLSPNGDSLVYSTFIGGSGNDVAHALVVDGSGVATIGGQTCSVDFPLSAGALDAALSGPNDGFVAQLSTTGSALLFSTHLGGSGSDVVRSIARDSNGAFVVAGGTTSLDFPVVPAGSIGYQGGAQDAFVATLDANGTVLTHSYHLGGSANDVACAVAVDSTDAVTVVGTTESIDFPTSSGSFDETHNGGKDVFVVRFVRSTFAPGILQSYGSFIGGNSSDEAIAMAFTPVNDLAVVGAIVPQGFPCTTNFPTTLGSFDPVFGPNGFFSFCSGDAFVAAIPSPQMSPCGILDFSLSLQGGGVVGDFYVHNKCGVPGALYVTALTFEQANSVNFGGGWWAGLHIPLIELSIEIGQGYAYGPAVPFVGVLDPAGSSLWSLPPGSVPPGLPTLYGVTRLLTPDWLSFIGDSNLATIQL